MAKNKTQETDANVADFIETFANTEQKKKDSFELIKRIHPTNRILPRCKSLLSFV